MAPLIHSSELAAINSLGDGFFEHYVDYARQLTDAPLIYHQVCALTIMSTIAGPSAVEPLLSLRPNLWSILLGPSTVFRKTTSLSIAAKLLRELDEDVFLPADFSPQSLVTEFSQRQGRSSLLVRDEVSGFFSTLKRADYMAGTKELLIKLYDGDTFHRRLQREEFRVNSPYFVWLSGAVTEKFFDSVTDADVFSGLLIRFILVLPKTKEPHRTLEYEHLALDTERSELLAELKHFREILRAPWHLSFDSYFATGNAPKYFVMENKSLSRFNRFVLDLEKTGVHDALLEKLNSRIGPLALKLMMLFALNHHQTNNCHLNIIKVDHRVVLKGIWWASQFQQMLLEALINIGHTKRERLYRRMLELVTKTPGIARSRIMRKLKLNVRDMDELEQTLVQRERIEVATRHGARGSYYFAKGETKDGTEETNKVSA